MNGHFKVMSQNLRVSPGDPRLPAVYEVPIQVCDENGQNGGNVIAIVYGNTGSSNESRERCLAYAKLLAASSKLLSACKEALHAHENSYPLKYFPMKSLQAAIADAEKEGATP
jgi:hypothetical protein